VQLFELEFESALSRKFNEIAEFGVDAESKNTNVLNSF
jgi:hypothetical protein